MSAYISLIPTFSILALGLLLKRANFLTTNDGKNILKYVFYIASPFLSIRAISAINLERNLLIFPLACLVFVTFSYIFITLLKNSLNLPTKTYAVMLIATMIVNSGFTLPFVLAKYGDTGAALIALFNIMNNILVFGVVYYIAVSYGTKGQSNINSIKKVLISPPLWGVFLGLVLNVFNISMPVYIQSIINPLADMTGPLMLLAFGIMWESKLKYPMQTLYSLLIRVLGGLILGYIIVAIFNLEGVYRSVMIMLAASPVGFNAVTFSSLEGLDDDFAVSVVSIGLLSGVVVMGVLSALL